MKSCTMGQKLEYINELWAVKANGSSTGDIPVFSAIPIPNYSIIFSLFICLIDGIESWYHNETYFKNSGEISKNSISDVY